MHNQLFVLILSFLLQACSALPHESLRPSATINPIQVIKVNERVVIDNNIALFNTVVQETTELAKLSKSFTYRLQIGDQINIIVWGHPELNNPSVNNLTRDPGVIFTIDQQGRIYYPYIGALKFAGLTPYEARNYLSRMLSKFIKDAVVNLVVVNYANAHIDVLGAVNMPKRIPLTEVPLTITNAISLAGGEGREGNIRNIILKRSNREYHIDLLAINNQLSSQIIMQPFDTVFVNRFFNHRVYILGEVYEPKVVWLEDQHANVAEALSAAKGFIIPRSNRKVYLLRFDSNGIPLVFDFEISSMSGILLSSQFKLKMNDVIYLSSKSITAWNDIAQQVLPTVMMTELATRSVTNIARARRDFQS
jgi:polysaccharide biosynthesis/export protein